MITIGLMTIAGTAGQVAADVPTDYPCHAATVDIFATCYNEPPEMVEQTNVSGQAKGEKLNEAGFVVKNSRLQRCRCR